MLPVSHISLSNDAMRWVGESVFYRGLNRESMLDSQSLIRHGEEGKSYSIL